MAESCAARTARVIASIDSRCRRERAGWRSPFRTTPARPSLIRCSRCRFSTPGASAARAIATRRDRRSASRRDHATPGFLAGPAPPGEWMVEVDIHCVIARPDGAPNRYELVISTLPSSEVLSVVRRPVPSPPVARGTGRRWYRGELHLHSTHSDGDWTPAEIAEAARPRDLDFMVLSDHNTVSSYEEFRTLVGPRTLVIPGTELTTYNGHCLAIGVEEWMDWRTGLGGRSINDVARAVRAAGGIFVVAASGRDARRRLHGLPLDARRLRPCARGRGRDLGRALGRAGGGERRLRRALAELDGARPPPGRHRRHRRAPPEGLAGCGAPDLRARGRPHAGRDPRRGARGSHVRLQRSGAVSRLRAGRRGGPLRGGPSGELRLIAANGARLHSAPVAGEGRLFAPGVSGWVYAELWNAGGDLPRRAW